MVTKVTRNTTRKIINVFHVPEMKLSDNSFPENQTGCELGACGASCGDSYSEISCGIPATGLDTMLDQFSKKHGERAEVRLADYSSEAAVSTTLISLNKVIKSSNMDLTVTPDNLGIVLSQSAPIIAIDGYIVSTQIVPSVDQLTNAVDGDLSTITNLSR